MKAENTLQYMMDFYGDIFWNRQKCLDHLFCVIGNGFEWQNGELVSKSFDERLSRWRLVTDIVRAEPTELIKSMGELHEERILTYSKTIKEPYNKWYPITKEYSYIYNYPADIKPDWLALINECKKMLKDDGIIIS